MTDKVIEYKSTEKLVTNATDVLEIVDKNDIICTWTGKFRNYNNYPYPVDFVWKFDWTKLKRDGVQSLTGHLIVEPPLNYVFSFPSQKIDIDWKDGKETVIANVGTQHGACYAFFEYHLTPHYTEVKKNSYDEMFAASDLTDAVLVVEGKKLHVNKAFLSYHSNFFRYLFSSHFKENPLTEIPIEQVSCEDFGLLMSTISLDIVFPNDRTAEKRLELADRFLMPAVTRQVEHHLLNNSKLSNEKLMGLADVYKMPVLLEKCVSSIDTVEKAKALETSSEYEKLSNEVKAKLFKRLLQLV